MVFHIHKADKTAIKTMAGKTRKMFDKIEVTHNNYEQ